MKTQFVILGLMLMALPSVAKEGFYAAGMNYHF
jgi:hypothetical protein